MSGQKTPASNTGGSKGKAKDPQEELEDLRAEFPRWHIRRTPGGLWWAERKRHLVRTEERLDLGFRYEYIAAGRASAVRKWIVEQQELHQRYQVVI